MEFEEYYELRFGRKPKLLRKATPCPGADVARVVPGRGARCGASAGARLHRVGLDERVELVPVHARVGAADRLR
jgi:hypothetical protein